MVSVAELLEQQQSKKKQEKAKLLEQEHQAEEEATIDVQNIRQQINDMIQSNPIVVYSKSYCPYCRQAKMMLNSLLSHGVEYKVIEMDDGNHIGWQTQVAEIAKDPIYQLLCTTTSTTNNDDDSDQGDQRQQQHRQHQNCVQHHNNTKSVPQIFIHQKYIGGADDLSDMYTNGTLFDMLSIPRP